MKTFGWLRAWMRVYLDCVFVPAAVTCLAVGLFADVGLLAAVGGGMVLVWLAARSLSEGHLRNVWLRLPWVMKYRRWRHGRWQIKVRSKAAHQRAGIGRYSLHEALADIKDQEACAEFVRDLRRLNADLAQADTDRKEHDQ